MKELIRDIPDFPVKGVLFRDISPILASAKGFTEAVSRMTRDIDLSRVDAIAGIESRGFILGAAIAARTGKGFIPIRKSGKLPPPVEFHAYALEYGEGVLEMKRGSGTLLIVDDVLATGGTLEAAIILSRKAGYTIHDVSVLVDLRYLNDFHWQPDQSTRRKANAAIEYSSP